MMYRVIDGVKLSDNGVSLEGPCPLTFGTPEQIAFWLACGAVEAAPVVTSEGLEPLSRVTRKAARRGDSQT